jgi:hypothetical protein
MPHGGGSPNRLGWSRPRVRVERANHLEIRGPNAFDCFCCCEEFAHSLILKEPADVQECRGLRASDGWHRRKVGKTNAGTTYDRRLARLEDLALDKELAIVGVMKENSV